MNFLVRKTYKQTNLRQYTILFLLLLICAGVIAGPPAHYPTPPDSEIRLFYLQRSTSKHTIIYDANILRSGHLNPKKPVDAYWLRYNKNNISKRRNLSFAERNFAYGLTFDKEGPNSYNIYLKAYSERDIKILINDSGNPVAQTTINNKKVNLKHIYIDVSGSGFWITVNYIELVGVGLKDGKLYTERFDPNTDDD